MKRSMLIAFSNIKANKGQSITFLIMILISSLLLNFGIVTYNDSSHNFDKQATEANCEDCMFTMQNNDYIDELENEIANDSDVSDYEVRDVILLETIFDYNDGEQAIRSIILNKDDEEIYNKSTIIEESSEKYNKPIYLPLILKTGGGYNLGDTFTLTSEGKDYSYTVAGFFNNISLGTTAVPSIGFILNNSEYEDLSKQLKHTADSKMYLIKLKDRQNASKYITSIYNKYTVKSPNSVCTRTYYSGIKNSRTFMSNIVAMIVVAFSIIIVAVSLIVVRFRIINSIEEDIHGIGALKATGYTSRQIILSYIVQFLLITLIGSILGILLSYTLIPILSAALEAQSGMIWKTSLNLIIPLITVITIVFITTVTVYFSTNKIKKLPPIDALRNGLATHNFKKNHLPLNSTKGNANFLLGMKTFLSNIKQNVMVSIIIAAVSFACVMILILYYNIAIENKAFVDAIAGEVPSISLTMTKDNYNEDLKDELLENDCVYKTMYADQCSLMAEDINSYFYIREDFSECNTDICYKGRNPIHSNEVALNGFMANELNKDIGDEITLHYGDISEKYLITGFVQSGNNMGYDAEITTEGLQRINKNYKNNEIYLYLNDNKDSDKFADYLKEEYGDKITNVFCVQNLVDAQLKAYVEISKILSYAIIISTFAIISLILYLIIKTSIIRNKVYYGIQKALGYTSKQLILQLSYSFILITTIGTIIGGLCGYFLTNGLFSVLLRSIGIMQIKLYILPSTIILTCLGIIIFSFFISLAVARRIKKISAISLIRE